MDKKIYVIETNYGYGWEGESEYDTRKEAERDFPEYVMLTAHYGGKARIKVRVEKERK